MSSRLPNTLQARYRLLLEMSRKISGTLDLPSVLSHLLESLHLAVAYDAAGIFVLNRNVPLGTPREGDLIAGVARVGFETPRLDDPMLRFGKGIIGHVIGTGEVLLAPDVRKEPHYVNGRDSTLSEVAVPIISNGEVIGALNLESDRLDAFDARDVELLEFFASAAALAIEKALLHRQVVEKERLDQQLRVARDVQSSLLPAASPDLRGYDFAAVNLPSWAVGGDYYDYLQLPDGRLGVVIADVSGKGVPAALIMATFRAALRAEARRGPEIPEVARAVNRILLESPGLARFVTAVYGVLEPAAGRFDYVNCGHNPPMLLQAEGGRESLETGGPALGILAECAFEAGRVALGPGDALVLYTDGVVEPEDETEAEFGTGRLEATLRESRALPAGRMVDSVVEATRLFSGRQRYEDDFTLVVVKRLLNGR